MPLFGSSNQFDADIDKATNELNVSEDWNLILDICDRSKASDQAAKDLLRSIQRKLVHPVPHVVKQALALLNSCVKNCDRKFLLAVSSREFVEELKNMLSDKSSHPKIQQQVKTLIKQWAEGEFKSDSALGLIPAFYKQLKAEGHDFSTDDIPKSSVILSKDPNVVSSQEEEEDIAKAIAASLKDAEGPKTVKSSHNTNSTTLYPAVSNNSSNSLSATARQREPRKVRALYDFEAVEDNELTFKAGEVIGVTDDSDPNWWKGVSWRGEGLFPANFVTLDLDMNDASDKEQERKVEHAAVVEPAPSAIIIDEDKIDRTLLLIQNADPTGESCPDPADLSQLEDECKLMNPLIDQELERVDKTHMRLSAINTELMTALQMYHTLMMEQTMYGGGYAGSMSLPTSHNLSMLPPASALNAAPPASYMSFDQMMNTQHSLSLSQIPHGISAQVGPQAVTSPPQQHTQAMHQSMGRQQQTMSSTVQYAAPGAGNSVQYTQPAGPMPSMQYGSMTQSANIPSATQQQQPVYNQQSYQQQQPVYAVPHQQR